MDFPQVSAPLIAIVGDMSDAPALPFTKALKHVAREILSNEDEASVLAAIENATGDADDWLPTPTLPNGQLVRKSSLRILGEHYAAAVSALESVPPPKGPPELGGKWHFEDLIYYSNLPGSLIRDIARFLAGMLSLLVIEFAASTGVKLSAGQAKGLFRYIPDLAEMAKKHGKR